GAAGGAGPQAAEAPAATEELCFAVSGMSCVNCARTIERTVGRLPGVAEARVNFAVEEGRVRFDPRRCSPDEIFRAVREAGYTPAPSGAASRARERRERRLFLFALGLAAAAFATLHLPLPPAWATGLLLLLATANQLGPGLDYYRGAANALRAGAANMDVLVALGIAASYGFSLLYLAGVTDHPTFETAIYLVCFIRLGKLLEERARGRASRALTTLASLQVDRARRRSPEGGWEEVPLAAVAVGDRIQVRPGERIPIDGVVVAGESAVDEQIATGEPLPVRRGPGDPVIGGTLNHTGVIEVEVSRTGEDAFLGQVIALVRAAQARPAPIQRLADRVSAVFVPAVVAVAALAFAAWLLAGAGLAVAVTRSVAVLVVACPCALGLATPTAILVASGLALGRGLLFKSGAALEALARVDRVVFDKTGTLTTGRPQVVAVEAAGGRTEAEVVALAAAVEWPSSHP
ncbi:MAG: cation-translocating P-type ATPase, partial [Nitrospirae bacterium]